MAATSVTRSYFFNPLTQAYSLERGDAPSVTVQITTPDDLSTDALLQAIRQCGNYMAITSVRLKSDDTQQNYCTDFKAHPGTCDQQIWRFCKRYLTEEEMETCRQIEVQLNPFPSLIKFNFAMNGMDISRGDVDLMRRTLKAVQTALS